MNEYVLKYGCNPNQKYAKVFMNDGATLPFEVLNGRAGFINLLDAFNSWSLVSELDKALDSPSAASFKHVSPSGVGIGKALDEKEQRAYFVSPNTQLSPLACAYTRARGTDRLCSFGDFIALSRECDDETAMVIKKEVSDGIIAPSYSKKALEILKSKASGNYTIIKIDKDYVPEKIETRQVFGISFQQDRNDLVIDKSLLNHNNIATKNKKIENFALDDLVLALITLKYTQSNSVCYAKNGQSIGVGAGQQSRIHCTRLAGNKADNWHLRQSDKVLSLPFRDDIKRQIRDNVIDSYINMNEENVLDDGIWQKYFTIRPNAFSKDEQREYLKNIKDVSLASDAFFPFSDNILRAIKSGVRFIAQPGGSIRDEDVISTCNEHDIVMFFTKARLFHH